MRRAQQRAGILAGCIIAPLVAGSASGVGEGRVAREAAIARDAAVAPIEVPDIEIFMQIGSAGQPFLSRDGGHLFFTASLSGTSQLYRLTDEGWPYQLTFFPNGIGGYNLSNDGRTLLVTAVPGGTELYQIYRIDAVTGATRALTDEPKVRFALPLFSPDDRTIYFGANIQSPSDFHIYAQDLATGERRPIWQPNGWSSVGDVSDCGRFLLVWNAVTSLDNNVYRVEVASGAATLLTAHEGEVLFSAGAFDHDPNVVYLVADEANEGIPHIVRVSGDPPTRGPMFPDTAEPWEVEALTISPDRKTLAWIRNEDGWGNLYLWDLEKRRSIPFPRLDGIVTNPSLAEGGKIAFAYNSPTQAPDVWTWEPPRSDRKGKTLPGEGTLRKMTHSTYAGIDPDWFELPRLIRYESFDGTSIPAFLYLPPGKKSGPIPFIIDVHGGPESQFRPYFNRHFQYLLLNGYGLLAPNVRGSTGYGRAYRDADNYKSRLDSVRDLAWGVKHLVAEGWTTPEQVGVKGASYGGYMTLAAMTEYPDLFAAGIDQVGIANFETFLARTAAYRRDFRASEYGPADDLEFLRAISPIYKIDQIRGALFVVHGDNDPRVPVGEARQILKALKDRGTPIDSLIFPDEGHSVSQLKNRLTFYRRMVHFFDRHLKGQTDDAENR